MDGDLPLAKLLRLAADGEIKREQFYDSFRPWYDHADSVIKDVIFREVEHYWAHFDFPRAPTNIIANDCMRLRLLAQALEEHWDVDRTETEIAGY